MPGRRGVVAARNASARRGNRISGAARTAPDSASLRATCPTHPFLLAEGDDAERTAAVIVVAGSKEELIGVAV